MSETIRDTVRVDARPHVSGGERVSLFPRCAKGEHRVCSGPRVLAQRDQGTHVVVGWDVCACPCHERGGS